MYLANRIYKKTNSTNLRNSKYVNQPKFKLSLTSEGFVARGQALMNRLDATIREEKCLNVFKSMTRQWVKKNIQVKPK